MPGMVEEGGATQVKYLPLDNVSSSEAEMDLSEDDDEGDQPKKKQARTSFKKAADGDSAPKWSNPDPYTALPPPDSERKGKDIVKLIKKARVEAGPATKTEVVTDDFISFESEEEDHIITDPIAGAPTGPRADTHSHPINLATSNPELGSRKRTIRDEIKDTPTLRQALAASNKYRDAPIIHPSSKGKKPPSKGNILSEWRGESTPWIIIDHSDTAHMGLR